MEIICPKHLGNFDCTPFCNLCEGNQSVTLRNPDTVQDRPGRPMLALTEPNVYRLLEHLNKDTGITRNLTDNLTNALRELQTELLQIAIREEA